MPREGPVQVKKPLILEAEAQYIDAYYLVTHLHTSLCPSSKKSFLQI